MRRFGRRLVWVLLYFNIVLFIGMAGYHAIEGWSWFESLYMAVITASCVGYAEVHPLSAAGRSFTMFLVAVSLVGLGLLWAMTTALLIELDLGDVLRKRRMMKRIAKMSGHYVVCGAGRMGEVIVQEMVEAGAPVVVVESSAERVEAMRESHPDIPIVEGDATADATLEAAGVDRAKGLAASLRDDSENLFLCLTARTMNPNLEISARAVHEETIAKLRRAGANHVVSPNVTGGTRIAATLLRPSVVNFLDATTRADDLALRLEESVVPAGSRLSGKTLAEARIPQETGLVVLALRRGSGPASYNPGPETQLLAGDVMIVLGPVKNVKRLNDYVMQ